MHANTHKPKYSHLNVVVRNLLIFHTCAHMEAKMHAPMRVPHGKTQTHTHANKHTHELKGRHTPEATGVCLPLVIILITLSIVEINRIKDNN